MTKTTVLGVSPFKNSVFVHAEQGVQVARSSPNGFEHGLRLDIGWMKTTKGGVSLGPNKGCEARPVRVLRIVKCSAALVPDTTTANNTLLNQHRLIADA